MKPSARYQAALETLDLIARIPLPMDLIIGDYMRSRRYIGSKDRAFIVTLVYDVMRHYGRLHWLGQRFGSTIYEPETGRENLYPGAKSGGGGDNKTESSTRSENQLPREQNIRQLLPACPSRLLLVLYMVSFQQWSLNDIAALFDGSRHAPTPLSPEETAVALAVFKNFSRRKRKHSSSESAPDSFPGSNEMPAAVRFECPPDLEKELRRRFGGDFDKEMSALVNPAPLDLRVNTSRTSRQEAAQSLAADKVETVPTPFSPWGLRCQEKVHLASTTVFRKGLVEIQDEGSQLIALLCAVKPGFQVLDYCAGGGGKTLALACMMEGKGRIVATDIDGRRLQKAKARLKRAGLSDNVETRSLAENRHRRWLKRQEGNFDCVLVDAPCSGTGTWRRNPDGRWFRYGPPLEDLLFIQREILNSAARAVKIGGRLVYATCSLLPCENEDQVHLFLDCHDDFKLLAPGNAWPEKAASPDLTGDEMFMQLSPLRHGCDGFFAAVLERQKIGQ